MISLPCFSSLEQLHLNKNRLKHVKYPSNLLPDGPLDDAAAVLFENLQVLLLGICLLCVCVLGGSRFCCLCHIKNPRFEHDSV